MHDFTNIENYLKNVMTYHEQTYLQWVNTNFYDTLGKHWGNNPEIKYNLSVWSLLATPNMKQTTTKYNGTTGISGFKISSLKD